MVFGRFLNRVQKYGVWRILFDADAKISVLLWLALLAPSIGCTGVVEIQCHTLENQEFLRLSTRFALALTALILTGLSVLVAFTGSKFLSELKNLGIYENIMFTFEYTFYLTGLTAVIGIVVRSYDVGVIGFYLFLLTFIYMCFSVVSLIQLIVEFGNKKAKYELNHN